MYIPITFKEHMHSTSLNIVTNSNPLVFDGELCELCLFDKICRKHKLLTMEFLPSIVAQQKKTKKIIGVGGLDDGMRNANMRE